MPTLVLDTRECPELQGAGIDDNIKLEIVGKPTNISEIRDGSEVYYSYTLEVAVTDYERSNVSLSDALDRAGKKHLSSEVRPYIG